MKNNLIFIFDICKIDMCKILNESLLIIAFFYLIIYTYTYKILIYKEYLQKCRQKEFINQQISVYPDNIFLSICIPAYNMEKYIESALLSLINQSFKYFEIIIVNDNSNDKTQNIIMKMQEKDKRIKYVNHSKNLGVYASRADGILNAVGKYILLMDPDDIILNGDLFKELYNYNEKYNLDIIEFLVYHQKEGKNNIRIPKDQALSHYHNYKKNIIIQPELSEIIYYKPNSKEYSQIICRTIWNKLIKKKIMLTSVNYLHNDYFKNQFLIAADDTPLNILSFHFANNYSNINLPGYLYNLREDGMSSDNKGNIEHDLILSYNFLLYFKFFFKYIILFNKDINFFLYDFKPFSVYLLKLKDLNATEYIPKTILFFKEIRNKNISETFKKYIDELIVYFLK